MDFMSVGSSWAFTYSAMWTKEDSLFKMWSLYRQYYNWVALALLLTIALPLHTETERTGDTVTIPKGTWRYSSMWLEDFSYWFHFNETLFSKYLALYSSGEASGSVKQKPGQRGQQEVKWMTFRTAHKTHTVDTQKLKPQGKIKLFK